MGLFKLKRKEICHAQNSKDTAVESLENGNYHMYRKLFTCKTTFFKMDPSARKLQEPGNKQNKSKKINRTVKLCTLATNSLIFS